MQQSYAINPTRNHLPQRKEVTAKEPPSEGFACLASDVRKYFHSYKSSLSSSAHHPSTSAHSHFKLRELLVLLELGFPLLLRPGGFHLFHQVPVNHRKARFRQPGGRHRHQWGQLTP